MAEAYAAQRSYKKQANRVSDFHFAELDSNNRDN